MHNLSSPSITLLPKTAVGIVDRAITPSQPGRIRFQGSFWNARFYNPNWNYAIHPGESITVVGRQGITLLVTLEEA
ncbi:MAG TPA: NfeD family protein [Allocoleopsis sp.]